MLFLTHTKQRVSALIGHNSLSDYLSFSQYFHVGILVFFLLLDWSQLSIYSYVSFVVETLKDATSDKSKSMLPIHVEEIIIIIEAVINSLLGFGNLLTRNLR